MFKKDVFKNMTSKELETKRKGFKALFSISIGVIILLVIFLICDYINHMNFDLSILTILICTLAGPILIYPGLKEIKEELKTRKN